MQWNAGKLACPCSPLTHCEFKLPEAGLEWVRQAFSAGQAKDNGWMAGWSDHMNGRVGGR
jgi:hypothetical protein